MILKNIASAILTLILSVPLKVLGGGCYGLKQLFECLSDAFFDAEKAVKPITMLPYIKDLDKKFEESKHQVKKRVLAELKGE